MLVGDGHQHRPRSETSRAGLGEAAAFHATATESALVIRPLAKHSPALACSRTGTAPGPSRHQPEVSRLALEMRSLARFLALAAVLSVALSTSSANQLCAFCVRDHLGASRAVDLADLPSGPFDLGDGAGGRLLVTPPCRALGSDSKCTPNSTPEAGSRAEACVALGGDAAFTGQPLSWVDPAAGVFLVQRTSTPDKSCPAGKRTFVLRGVCDPAAAASRGPDQEVVENPTCTFTVSWRHKAFCSEPAESAFCTATIPKPTPDQLAWQVRAQHRACPSRP